MPTGAVIDVLIGLTFVYVLLSVACSALHEAMASLLGLRQRTLRRGIETLLDSAPLQQLVYDHPLIRSLSHGTGARKPPAYIPASLFAAALADAHKAPCPPHPKHVDAKSWAEEWQRGLDHVAGAMEALVGEVRAGESELLARKRALGRWFDASMERCAGAYKRDAQLAIVGIALALAFALNADSLAIARALWAQPVLRDAVARSAADWVPKQQAGAPPTGDFSADWTQANQVYGQATTELDALRLPIGWSRSPGPPSEWLAKLVGLLFTAVAISLGAPFWFDALNRLLNLRGTGAPPPRGQA